MPVTVKLSTAEHRAWRVNKAQWVSPQGIVLRAVTAEEEKSLFPAVERTKAMGKTQSYPLTVVYRTEDPESGAIYEQKTAMEAMVRVTHTGRERHNYVLDVFVNGCRYVKGREIIEKRMLATHGECNLHGPNGKRIRVIRNPAMKRPSYSESQRSAPHPHNCPCRAWRDRQDPDRHHAACEWNAKAPPAERATPFQPVLEPTIVESPEPLESLAFDPTAVRRPGVPFEKPRGFVVPPPGIPRSHAVQQPVLPGQQRLSQDPALVAPTVARTVRPAPNPAAPVQRSKPPEPKPAAVYSPSACPEDCRGFKNPEAAWRWPEGRREEKGQHHPLCPHDGAFRQKLRGGQRWMLYDIARHIEVREATLEEVTNSELEMQKNGTRSVTVGGHIFAVVQSGTATPPSPRGARPAVPVQKVAIPGAEARRQVLLEESQLPPVPAAAIVPMLETVVAEPGTDDEEIVQLRARLAELERREVLRQPVGPGVAPFNEPHPDFPTYDGPPIAMSGRPAVGGALSRGVVVAPTIVAAPADYLRNEMGLVGNQQVGDDIPTGPVQLVEPEPFIDPLRHRQSTPAAATRPKGFVPPGLPGVSDAPVAEPVAVYETPVSIDGQEALEGVVLADDEAGAASSLGATDEEVAALIAEATAAQAELDRLDAEEALAIAAGGGPDDESEPERGDESEETAALPPESDEGMAAAAGY